MRKKRIFFLYLSGIAMVGLSIGLVESYFYNDEFFRIKDNTGKEIKNEIHLTSDGEVLFPGEEKSYTIEVDFPQGAQANCSLYFTEIGENAGSLLSVRVNKDDYQSKEEKIGKLTPTTPLKFSSYIDEEHKNFLLTYKVADDLGGIASLDASFCCHLEVRKGDG